jgi:hypothetical protein
LHELPGAASVLELSVSMSFFTPGRIVRGGLLTGCLLTLSVPVWAQEQSGFAKNGGYVGISGILDFSFGGETFNGQTVYKQEDGDEILILPKFEGAHNALRAVAGYRQDWAAFEVSYDRTKHEGTFQGFSGEGTFHALNFDYRVFLLNHSRIQPHVLIGGSIPWMTVKDGSFLDPRVGDGSFRGFGINTEAGVTVFPIPRVGISTGYRYRVMWFDSARGVTDTTYELHPRFHETTGSLVITGTFTF